MKKFKEMAKFQVLRQGFSSEIDPLNEDSMDLIFGGKQIIKCSKGYHQDFDNKGNTIIRCGCGYSLTDDGKPDDSKIEKPEIPSGPVNQG